MLNAEVIETDIFTIKILQKRNDCKLRYFQINNQDE